VRVFEKEVQERNYGCFYRIKELYSKVFVTCVKINFDLDVPLLANNGNSSLDKFMLFIIEMVYIH